ncbi:MAG: hypothetical protein GY710_06710 [Desulfobacteraceae bacterium]|nr:hypothetical protein [Desulfobacteraceae bacterium]
MNANKKKILWLIQSNQITSTICDFLQLLQNRTKEIIDLSFIVPETSSDILDKTKNLSPTCFKLSSRFATKSYQGFLAKKQILSKTQFPQGLAVNDVLLLDDLGGGNVTQTTLNIKKQSNTCGLILQIPTPLGSSDSEERVFQAAVVWATQNQIPIIGYELLPLDIRWTLTTSLPDGVITKSRESHDYLKEILDHKNIWLLPLSEASIFSSTSSNFHLNGVKASYHYKTTHKIPEDRTVLYLPHNVAITYEYQEMLKIIAPMGKKIHLMFGYGEDQVRGAHSQNQMIETIYKNELNLFASYSFHNTNSLWEMLMADSLVACSACFQTDVAQAKNIPTIIYDPMLKPITHGFKLRVNKAESLQRAIKDVITLRTKQMELGTIFMHLAKRLPDND